MAALMTSLGLDRLPPDDRLALAQELWSSLPGAVPGLTDAQRQELRRRVAEDDADPDGTVSWDEALAAALSRTRK